MLSRLKTNGARSSADKGPPKRGGKGRLELVAYKDGDGFAIEFKDFGNFGKLRWQGNFGQLTEDDVYDMIDCLSALVDGALETTDGAVSFDVQEECETTAELAEEEKKEAVVVAAKKEEQTEQSSTF